MRYFSNADLIELVRAECDGRSQKEWAAKNGLAASYVSDFLNGRRDAGPALLRALGFDPQPFYRKASR